MQLVAAYEAMSILTASQDEPTESRVWATKLVEAARTTSAMMPRKDGLRLQISALTTLSYRHHQLKETEQAQECDDEIQELQQESKTEVK